MLHVDIGGEGRHPNAINVNRWGLTSTTGAPGQPIPNLVQGLGERIPIASGLVDKVTVENAPLGPATAEEIARLLRPGGTVGLLHPSAYAATAHDTVARALGADLTARSSMLLPDDTTLTILRRAVDLLR